MADLIVFATTIIIIVFIIPLFTSGIKAIRYHDNFFNCIKEKYLNLFENIDYLFSPYLYVVIPIIIFFSIGNLFSSSGAIAEIGNFFESNEFTAKYRATVNVSNTGSLPETHPVLNIDGKTVNAVIDKHMETYNIKSIEYLNYILIDDSNQHEYSQIKNNKNIYFSPTKIYINGKEYMTYDYAEDSAYYDKPPTFKVILSNKLIENLTNTGHPIYYLILISYIIFMCLLVIYLTWVVYKMKNSKKASIIAFVISLIISILLVVFPLIYIYLNASYNVTENSVTSSQTKFDSSQTDIYERIYLLNPDSMKIHRYDCHTIKHKENYIKTTDFESAIGNEFEPCQVCKPENEFNELLDLGISDAKKAEEKMNKFNEQTDKELEKRLKHIEKTNAKRAKKYRKLQQQAEEKMNKYNESLKQ